eukprot:2153709-Amphidinium_carterae.2
MEMILRCPERKTVCTRWRPSSASMVVPSVAHLEDGPPPNSQTQESEYYACLEASAEGLGLAAMAAELGDKSKSSRHTEQVIAQKRQRIAKIPRTSNSGLLRQGL